MRNAIVVILGALSVLACSKDKPADDANTTTTTRSGSTETPAVVTVDEVRTVLLEKQPGAAEAINAMMITNDNGVITLRGKVDDEATHVNLVNRARSMPAVRSVKDEIVVMPKTGAIPGAAPSDPTGAGATTTGATGGGSIGQGGTMTQGAAGAKSDAVRQSMEKARPKAQSVIHALTITDDGTVVTVSGMVPDEPTHQALIKAAKDTSGVKTVRDDLKVQTQKKQ